MYHIFHTNNKVFLYILIVLSTLIKLKNIMVRIIFAVIIFIHGLIHLMGFVNQLNIKKISQFTGVTLFPVSESLSKILGIVWLITALLFIITAAGFSLGKDWWSIIGIIAIVISQLLIIIYWKDAKAGTIANAILSAGIMILM